MYYGLYMSAAGAHSQSQKVEVLSNNLANVDTVGFKRELALLEARDSEAIERGMSYRGSRTINDIGGGSAMPATATSFGMGNLKETGDALDLALEQPNAFFNIQHDGQQLLTRAGNFELSTTGRLTNADGDAVLSTDGSPIDLDPELPWRMLPGGRIEQAGAAVEVGISQVQSLAALQKVGSNNFSATGTSVLPALPEDRRVRNGFLEMSSVNSVDEMVELIATQRGYETNIRMIQHHDTMTGSLISRMMRAS